MDKNKAFYLTLIVIFCVVLAGGGGYIIGENINRKEDLKETKTQYEIIDSKENSSMASTYGNEVYLLLYNYIKSGKTNLQEYLNGLNNAEKIYAGGFDGKDYSIAFSQIKLNLINTFGSDLGITNILNNGYKYDESLDSYYYDSETQYIIYEDSNFELKDIYNYKLIEEKVEDNKEIISYYGLYNDCYDVGPCKYSGKNNFEIFMLKDDTESFDEYNERVAEAFAKAFKEHKEAFYIFNYFFEENNFGKFDNYGSKYVLVDFKQV